MKLLPETKTGSRVNLSRVEHYTNRLLRETESHAVGARLAIVEACFDELGAAGGWRLLREEWTYSEVTAHYSVFVMDADWDAKSMRTARRNFMDARDWASFRRLRFPLRVYRGGGDEDSILDGLSWTRSRTRAHFFAGYACGLRRSYFGMASRTPMIASALAWPSDVFAVKLGRGEREVVLVPGSGIGSRARSYPSARQPLPSVEKAA